MAEITVYLKKGDEVCLKRGDRDIFMVVELWNDSRTGKLMARLRDIRQLSRVKKVAVSKDWIRRDKGAHRISQQNSDGQRGAAPVITERPVTEPPPEII